MASLNTYGLGVVMLPMCLAALVVLVLVRGDPYVTITRGEPGEDFITLRDKTIEAYIAKCPSKMACQPVEFNAATFYLNAISRFANTKTVGCGTADPPPDGAICIMQCTNGQAPSKDVHQACGPDVDSTGLIEPSVATVTYKGEWLVYKKIGIEYEEIIANERLSQSSGRGERGRLNADLGWSPLSNDANRWITVDLLNSNLVSGVITQSMRDYGNRVLEYKVAYQAKASSAYEYVLNANGGKLFTGNTDDSNTPVMQLFLKNINATNVKIEPTKWFAQKYIGLGLRFELLGHRLN